MDRGLEDGGDGVDDGRAGGRPSSGAPLLGTDDERTRGRLRGIARAGPRSTGPTTPRAEPSTAGPGTRRCRPSALSTVSGRSPKNGPSASRQRGDLPPRSGRSGTCSAFSSKPPSTPGSRGPRSSRPGPRPRRASPEGGQVLGRDVRAARVHEHQADDVLRDGEPRRRSTPTDPAECAAMTNGPLDPGAGHGRLEVVDEIVDRPFRGRRDVAVAVARPVPATHPGQLLERSADRGPVVGASHRARSPATGSGRRAAAHRDTGRAMCRPSPTSIRRVEGAARVDRRPRRGAVGRPPGWAPGWPTG